ncbi:hypothetical protein Tco_1248235, partial [Tanacetum coccineum]
MSSPDRPISNLEGVFSSNFPNHLPPISPDYIPTSPGKTYSTFYTEKSPIPSPIIIHPKTQEFFLPEVLLSPMELSPSTPSQPQALEIEEIPLEHFKQIKNGIEGLGKGTIIIQHDFDALAAELQQAHTQITKLRRKMPPKRASTTEAPTMTQDAIRKLVADSVTESVFSLSRCAEENKVTFATGTLTDDALS